jgi:hypothetical protein
MTGGQRRGSIGTGALYAVFALIGLSLMLTGCSISAAGRPVAAPGLGHWQPPPIPNTDLEDLLLTAGDIHAIPGGSSLEVRRPVKALRHGEEGLADRNCLDAYDPAESTVYAGSNWTAVKGQLLDDGGDAGGPAYRHSLTQVVVGFRDAASAQDFFAQAKQRWSACSNRSVTFAPPGYRSSVWEFADAVATETTLTMSQTEENTGGWRCQRAMGLRNNVIIDAMFCGYDATDQAGAVVNKIADAVSRS